MEKGTSPANSKKGNFTIRRRYVKLSTMIIEALQDRIEMELASFMDRLDQEHSLSKTSLLLFRSIKEFVTRKGKRIRPILFLLGYLGLAERPAENLYQCALSIELLHDFTLVHDDIIDNSPFRRGKPSMHAGFAEYLKKRRRTKFNGKDMALVAGDIMYALALSAFLMINERWDRKEKAFKRLIRSAVSTGSGEFAEILCGTNGLERITKTDIYRIYELKTADYTFATPLAVGAILAGADEKETGRLRRFGKNAGIAFQIKDDLLDILDAERTGWRVPFINVQEAKLTIPVWYAYRHSPASVKKELKNIFNQEKNRADDWKKLREIVKSGGACAYAEKEIGRFLRKAKEVAADISMKGEYKKELISFSANILSIPPKKVFVLS